MNKRVMFLILSMIIIVTMAYFLGKNWKDTEIIKKGYELFGDDYCLGHNTLELAGDAFGGWDCALCGRNTWDAQMPGYVLCYSCEKVTGRCHKCGKLLRDNK